MKSKLIALTAAISITSVVHAYGFKLESDARLSDGVTEEQAAVLVQMVTSEGYTCNSVSAVTPNTDRSKWLLTCNEWYDQYTIRIRGGKYTIEVGD